MKVGLRIATPHDGVYDDPDITFDRVAPGRTDVLLDGNPIARLEVATHRLWSMNPFLRVRLLQQQRAETLVSGNSCSSRPHHRPCRAWR